MGLRRLDCAVQTYKWGKKGKDSLVARLKMSDDPNFDIDEVMLCHSFSSLIVQSEPYTLTLFISHDQPLSLLGFACLNVNMNEPLSSFPSHGIDNYLFIVYFVTHILLPPHQEETYAEMWLGTHPKGSCRVYPDDNNIMENGTKMHLIDILHKDKKVLQDNCELNDIPFMLKILSIGKALSIQAHPDTLKSRRLYSVRPDLYKDSTHKPEMSVALTTVEAMCGFRPFHEMVYFLQCYPELRSLVSSESLRAFVDAPQDNKIRQKAFEILFNDYVTTRESVASKRAITMVNRLHSIGRRRREQNGEAIAGDVVGHAQEDQQKAEKLCLAALGEEIGEIESRRIIKSLCDMDSHIQGVILRLAEQYPGDIGLMMPLILNYLKLEPGQCFYTAPNEPHCYISGNTIEVGASSASVLLYNLLMCIRLSLTLLC